MICCQVRWSGRGLLEAVQEFINQVKNKQAVNIQLYVVKEIRVPKEKEIHISGWSRRSCIIRSSMPKRVIYR